MYAYGYFNSFKTVASGAVPFDADAQAFITAASITDPTQQSAVNQLVLDLKSASIWTKMKAVYPFIGGSASSHKWNLKDPRDLDAAYRLLFNGGWTHSSTGALPNGSNGFANTFLNPSTALGNNSSHMSYYSRTASTAATTVEIGCQQSSILSFMHIRAAVNYLAGALVITNFSTTGTAAGFWVGSKTASNARETYRNGTSENTNTTNYVGHPNEIIFLAARSDDFAPAAYSDKEVAFASIGEGLSDAEVTSLNNAVQTFQTTLSRNV